MLEEPFRLDDWEVYPAEARMCRNDEVQALRPKAMAVLCVLADARGALVTRETLLDEVWGPRAVSDEPLTATIGELRRLLGDRRGDKRYIETVPKRGYRVVPEVSTLTFTAAPFDQALAASMPPLLRRPSSILALVAALLVLVTAYRVWDQDPDVSDQESLRAIAVLPFSASTGGTELEFFGEAIAQEILTALTRIPGLRVAARQSTLAVADQRSDLDNLREALDVDAVLDGQITIEKGRIRIHAQLVDLRDGFNRWAQRFEGTVERGTALQVEVAEAVARALGLTPADVGLLTSAFDSQQRYLDYLRGRFLYENGRSEAELTEADSLLRSVIDVPTPSVDATTALAGVQVRLADLGYREDYERAYDEARALSRRALALSSEHAEAHLLLGWAALYGAWDWHEARRFLARALELAPGDRSTLSANAALNYSLGSLEKAVRLAEMAADSDPLSASANYNLAYFRFAAGAHGAARSALARAVTLEPVFPGVGLLQAQIDLAVGDIELAASRHESNPILARVKQALVANAAGETAEARAALAELVEHYAEEGAYQVATTHAQLGNIDEALSWLQRSLALRDPGLAEAKVDPLLEPLRGDSRYRALLQRLGLDDPFTGDGPAVL